MYETLVLVDETILTLLLLPNCSATETSNPELLGQPKYPSTGQVWQLSSSTGLNVSVPASFPALQRIQMNCYAPGWLADPQATAGYCKTDCLWNFHDN